MTKASYFIIMQEFVFQFSWGKEHSLIWKAKPLTIQTGEGESLKN